MPPPAPVYEPIEQEILTILANSKWPPDVERVWLIRALAASRTNHQHEIVYRIITGFQINLLLAANTPAPPDIMAAQTIYDQATTMYPDLYKNFPFDAWLRYPMTAGLLRADNSTPGQAIVYRITLLGQDFLHYLINSGLTATKYG
jgi:hypothetical protein